VTIRPTKEPSYNDIQGVTTGKKTVATSKSIHAGLLAKPPPAKVALRNKHAGPNIQIPRRIHRAHLFEVALLR
jgi:hypothetical protein